MGKIFCFGSDVDTDQIIASQYLLYPSVEEMAPHCFESLDENFATAVQAGDFVVARDNFGCGSSRGVRAVFANSFARIFFRNAINIGLPVIVCENLIERVKPGEELSLDLENGTVTVGGQNYRCTKLPQKMQEILDRGGLIAALNREEA